ncbi:MAG: DUF4390 domain-containing protein [Planctomycetales bacterium]|nr:DUF4390 domain-containing protein [Planctomycetales bacterium]
MFFSTWVTPSHAQSVRGAGIAELSARADGQAYLVSFQVDGAFTEDLEEAIQAGIPTTFTYLFRVKRHVTAWFDERIAEFQVRRTVDYDNIREVYTVSHSTRMKKRPASRSTCWSRLMTLPLFRCKKSVTVATRPIWSGQCMSRIAVFEFITGRFLAAQKWGEKVEMQNVSV